MADYGTFKRGKREFPLDAASSNELLYDADPFIFYALEFFQAVIERHVGPRLMAAVDGISSIEVPVAYTVPLDPLPFLGPQVHYRFPLLAVYRRNGRLEERTVAWRHDASTFEVAYILPPLSASEAERVVPILTAIRDVLDDRASYGMDPAYTPTNGTAGQQIWVDLAGCEKVGFREAEWGIIPSGDGLAFFSLRMRGEVAEREDTPTTGLQDFAGADVRVDALSPDGSVVADVATVDTRAEPTISAVSPEDGVYSGGVAITITGTLFYNPVQVYVGGKPALNVVRVNTTTITCTSPAHDASAIGTALDVTVGTDFGEATLADAFTLTA